MPWAGAAVKELELSLGQEDLVCPCEGLLPVPEASVRSGSPSLCLLGWISMMGIGRAGAAESLP